MAFENFPYVDLHTLNLEWLLKKLKELENAVTELTERVKELEEE